MIKFTVRLTKGKNDQLLSLINVLQKEQQIKISKNQMIIKLIGDKYNEQKTN